MVTTIVLKLKEFFEVGCRNFCDGFMVDYMTAIAAFSLISKAFIATFVMKIDKGELLCR